MTIDADGLPGDAADRIDLRAVVLGSIAQRSARDEHWGVTCPDCTPFGPLTYADQQFSVPVAGQLVTAIGIGDLRDVWSFETGVEGPQLHQGPGVVYVDAPAAMLTQLDAATGSLRWQLQRDIGEGDTTLTTVPGGLVAVASSRTWKADDGAPLVRLVVETTGEVRWTAAGRAATEWQWGGPQFVSAQNLVVMTDVIANPAAAVEQRADTLRAYRVSDGSLAWTADLGGTSGGFFNEVIWQLEVETGPVLLARRSGDGDLVRVDSQTGQVLWRRDSKLVTGIAGTDYAPDGRIVIDLTTQSGHQLVDPATGQNISR